jgi:5-methylcytosine-specific restriction endonuclease McrA
MSFEELEHELASLASHLHAGMCRWLELVAEVERRGELAGNTADWLAWRCGLMRRTAREHVRIARRLVELPLIRAAFGRGELSYAKVRALTRIAERETEEELLGIALEMTAAQLDRAVRAYRRVTTDDAVALQENAYLQWYWDEDGSLVLRGQLAPEDGAVFLQALESAHQALRERGSAEPRQTNADALVAIAELALSGGSSSGGERHQVVVHVDESALADEAEGGCELDDGPSLAPETARRLACDSSVVHVRERDGKTLSVGRKTRSVPPSVRRALKRRDRGCRFPGCENRLFVDAHHIQHWVRGGETSLDNLVLLCRRHHRFVHEGGYSVDEELRFRDPWGAPVPNAPRPPPGSIEPLLRDGVGTYAIAWVDRMDLDLAVQALLAATA